MVFGHALHKIIQLEQIQRSSDPIPALEGISFPALTTSSPALTLQNWDGSVFQEEWLECLTGIWWMEVQVCLSPWTSLGGLETRSVSQPGLPHRVFVRIKCGWAGEESSTWPWGGWRKGMNIITICIYRIYHIRFQLFPVHSQWYFLNAIIYHLLVQKQSFIEKDKRESEKEHCIFLPGLDWIYSYFSWQMIQGATL